MTLGGEASGHLLCLDKTSIGDGIDSALQVLEVMVGQRKSLEDLAADVQKRPQTMINVPRLWTGFGSCQSGAQRIKQLIINFSGGHNE